MKLRLYPTWKFLALFFCLGSTLLEAQFLNWPESNIRREDPGFLAPNEYRPHENKAIEAYIEGILIIVGSERAFITAAHSSAIKGLLIIDKTPPLNALPKSTPLSLKNQKHEKHILN